MVTPSTPTRPDTGFGVRSVLALSALALVAVPFGLLLFLVQDRWPPLRRVDDGARDALHRLALEHPAFADTMRALSTFGSAPVYVVVFTLVTAWLAHRRMPRLACWVAVTQLGGAALNELVKLLVDRARPVVADPIAHASGLSFPSGHAQAAVVAYSMLLLLTRHSLHRAWWSAAVACSVVVVLGIGLSRVALSVHYVSDVLAGYALGGAWVVAMTAAFTAWRADSGKPPVPPGEEVAEVVRDDRP
ncbi:phosphatase PAP2 family protein [Actinosynnema sp. NPDC020468]|uniref:phosphatase PAP2 family protein n=1 Tax=Actinosynnema sp. NPDC020468 TaxID=3154488 RepID=UPI0033DF5B02